MGRTKPSKGLAPTSHRKDARAKHARVTINKTIPAILASNPRARQGVENAELMVSPPAPKSLLSATKKNTTAAVSVESHETRGEENVIKTKEVVERGGTELPFELRLIVADTLAAALSLHSIRQSKSSHNSSKVKKDAANKNIAVLNMASPLRAGGGLLNGATSQEETLCLHSTLYPSLRDEFYRLPELGAAWTPDVLVFRDSHGKDLEKGQRWWIDVISAAMLRFPDVEVVEGETSTAKDPQEEDDSNESDSATENDIRDDGQDSEPRENPSRYSDPSDRSLVVAKMTAVLRILHSKGARRIVLGAWGCGAYRNPVCEIAQAWRKVLFGEQQQKARRRRGGSKSDTSTAQNVERWDGFEEVVFAIRERKMAEEFAAAFGPELIIEDLAVQGTAVEQKAVPVADAGDELEAKIEELEQQIQQVMNPGLKDRMETVLQGLRKDLISKRRVDHDDENDDNDNSNSTEDDQEQASVDDTDNDYDNDITEKKMQQDRKPVTEHRVLGIGMSKKKVQKKGKRDGSHQGQKKEGDLFEDDPFFDDDFFDQRFLEVGAQKDDR